MLYISRGGIVDAEKIKVKIFEGIERAKMDAVNGIVVHQTGGATAQSTFNSYVDKGANGAHFLIDKDGAIYQTASLFRVTNHVGLLQSRCVLTKKCSATDLKHAQSLERIRPIAAMAKAVHGNESKKSFPGRFPSNADSIGIEVVGTSKEESPKNYVYEPINDSQNSSLAWLIKELVETLGVSMQEIYRHPDVGRKNVTEASTAKW